MTPWSFKSIYTFKSIYIEMNRNHQAHAHSADIINSIVRTPKSIWINHFIPNGIHSFQHKCQGEWKRPGWVWPGHLWRFMKYMYIFPVNKGTWVWNGIKHELLHHAREALQLIPINNQLGQSSVAGSHRRGGRAVLLVLSQLSYFFDQQRDNVAFGNSNIDQSKFVGCL